MEAHLLRSSRLPAADRCRHFWPIPFAFCTTLVLFSAPLLLLFWLRGGWHTLAFWAAAYFCALGCVGAVLSRASRGVPWLIVRLQTPGGRASALACPLPRRLLRGGLWLARWVAPENWRDVLENAGTLLRTWPHYTHHDALLTILYTHDGDRIDLFIG